MRSSKFLIAALLGSAACQPLPEGMEEESQSAVTGESSVVIDWVAPKRTYAPTDGCLADLQPSTDFILGRYKADEVSNYEGWPVVVDACKSSTPEVGQTFDWSFTVPGQQPLRKVVEGDCRAQVNFPGQGTYQATLTIRGVKGGVFVGKRDIVVRDYLIVSMGDSMASGEGNPDQVRDGNRKAVWNNEACHRSWFSGPARAAIQLEDEDPHSSVTFISTACSGDAIGDGILTERNSRQQQINRVKHLTRGRKIDVLLLQAGANDIHFGEIAYTCAHPSNNPLVTTVVPGVRQCSDTLGPKVAADMATLPGLYDRLASAVQTLAPSKVVISEYTDPTKSESRSSCEIKLDTTKVESSIETFLFPEGVITKLESSWASAFVVLPLNNNVRQAASRYGWDLVAIEDDSLNHGYCSVDPWVRTWEETFNMQGDKEGVFHANSEGNKVYAKRIVDKVRPLMSATRGLPAFASVPTLKDQGRCRGAEQSFVPALPPPPPPPPPSDHEEVNACDQRCFDQQTSDVDSCVRYPSDNPLRAVCECSGNATYAECINRCKPGRAKVPQCVAVD